MLSVQSYFNSYFILNDTLLMIQTYFSCDRVQLIHHNFCLLFINLLTCFFIYTEQTLMDEFYNILFFSGKYLLSIIQCYYFQLIKSSVKTICIQKISCQCTTFWNFLVHPLICKNHNSIYKTLIDLFFFFSCIIKFLMSTLCF